MLSLQFLMYDLLFDIGLSCKKTLQEITGVF